MGRISKFIKTPIVRPKRVSISFTENELFLLDDGFGTSYMADESDPDIVKLMKIREKLSAAMRKF